MNNEPMLISTKLKMPMPRNNYIKRERLYSLLTESSQCKVTIIKGAAGTGKTTLLTSFIQEQEYKNYKWITLDQENNNIFSFWHYLLQAIYDQLGEQSKEILSLFKSVMQKEDIQKILVMIINQLDSEKDIRIVLDDFHHIQDSDLLETITFFIKYSSEKVGFMILTRSDCPMYLGDLIMDGKVLEISEEQLRISSEEGIIFLKSTLNLNIEDKLLYQMTNLAEGWIGGLQLLALASTNNREKWINNIKVLNKYVIEYLSKEILEGLDEIEREFLIKTSVLNYFNDKICDRLLNHDNSQKIIETLLDKNLFIITIDEEEGIYRYHNMFGEFLKLQFLKLDKEMQKNIHINAYHGYEELGDLDESIKHAFEIERFEEAVRLIEKMGQNPKGWTYLSQIPLEYLVDSRDMLFQRMFYYFCNMDFDECKNMIALLSGKIDNPKVWSVLQFAKILMEGNNIDVELISQDEIEEMNVSDVTKAIIYLKTSTFLGMQERYKEAIQYINRAGVLESKINNPYIKFFVFTLEAQVNEALGDLNKCEQLYEELFKMIEENKLLQTLNENQYIAVSGIYTKKGDLDKAQWALDKAGEVVEEKDGSMIDFGYLYNLMELKLLQNQRKEAEELLFQLFKFDLEKNHIYIPYLLKYAYYLRKAPQQCIDVFEHIYNSNAQYQSRLENKYIYAKNLYHRNEEQKALELLNDVLSTSRKNNIKLKLVETLLFKIQVIQKDTKSKRDVLNLLREAIYYSYENRIISPYLYIWEDIKNG